MIRATLLKPKKVLKDRAIRYIPQILIWGDAASIAVAGEFDYLMV